MLWMYRARVEVSAYMQQAQHGSNIACVFNRMLLIQQGTSDAALHQYAASPCRKKVLFPYLEMFLTAWKQIGLL